MYYGKDGKDSLVFRSIRGSYHNYSWRDFRSFKSGNRDYNGLYYISFSPIYTLVVRDQKKT